MDRRSAVDVCARNPRRQARVCQNCTTKLRCRCRLSRALGSFGQYVAEDDNVHLKATTLKYGPLSGKAGFPNSGLSLDLFWRTQIFFEWGWRFGAQADGRTAAAVQFVVAVGFASLRLILRCALCCLDNVDCLRVFAICAPPMGWSRLMLIPTLNTSDRTRTTWATTRHAGLRRFAGFNPNQPSTT